MAQIGIEYIEHFAAARAAGVIMNGGQDVSNGSDVAEGLRGALESRGHAIKFHWIETDVFEVDRRDQSLGVSDQQAAGGVDLFFICSHGWTDDARPGRCGTRRARGLRAAFPRGSAGAGGGGTESAGNDVARRPRKHST